MKKRVAPSTGFVACPRNPSAGWSLEPPVLVPWNRRLGLSLQCACVCKLMWFREFATDAGGRIGIGLGHGFVRARPPTFSFFYKRTFAISKTAGPPMNSNLPSMSKAKVCRGQGFDAPTSSEFLPVVAAPVPYTQHRRPAQRAQTACSPCHPPKSAATPQHKMHRLEWGPMSFFTGHPRRTFHGVLHEKKPCMGWGVCCGSLSCCHANPKQEYFRSSAQDHTFSKPRTPWHAELKWRMARCGQRDIVVVSVGGHRIPPAARRLVCAAGLYLRTPRTALKDSPQGPATADCHQPPTATNHQPPTSTNRQPPPTTNHQPPTIVQYCFCGAVSCPCLDQQRASP